MGYLVALGAFVLFAYLFPIAIGRLKQLPSPAQWWRQRRAARQAPEQHVVSDSVTSGESVTPSPVGDVDHTELAPGVYTEASENFVSLVDTTTPERQEWLRHAVIPPPGEGRVPFVISTAARFGVSQRQVWRDLAKLEGKE